MDILCEYLPRDLANIVQDYDKDTILYDKVEKNV